MGGSGELWKALVKKIDTPLERNAGLSVKVSTLRGVVEGPIAISMDHPAPVEKKTISNINIENMIEV